MPSVPCCVLLNTRNWLVVMSKKLKFKVGDRVRIKIGLKAGYTAEGRYLNQSMASLGGKEFSIRSSADGPYDWRLDDSDFWSWLEEWLELAYPDTPAGRKQEQLDLIAEKEVVLAETQAAIDAAKAKIAEIDNRPPSVGDKYRSRETGAIFEIIGVFEHNGKQYANYIHGTGSLGVVRATSWALGGFERVND